MKNKTLEIVAFIVFCYSIIMLALSSFPRKGNVDYPCSVIFSNRGCLTPTHCGYEGEKPRNINIEIYLDWHTTDFYGFGCHHEFSDTNELIVHNHLLQRDGENLIIDKKIILKKDEKWKDIKILSSWNPWKIKKEKFLVVNRGVVNCIRDCETRNIVSYGPALIITGSVGTYHDTNFMAPLIFIMSVLMLVYNHKRIYKKKKI